ncbi:hypothetical protein [Saccharibacillus sacchari]|uniref:hypothetical protein n=1 Tax=Saccharibacillus sacchari TaxID=456493 RepID=UPI0004AE6F16|nr:hypothetical protein [Saccharibacillus sacchari]
MRFMLVVLIVLLTACGSQTDPVEQESQYRYVEELGGIPVPVEAKQLAFDAERKAGKYEVPQDYDSFHVSYHDKLDQEGWTLTEIESSKVISVEKNGKKFQVIVTGRSSDENISNLSIKRMAAK